MLEITFIVTGSQLIWTDVSYTVSGHGGTNFELDEYSSRYNPQGESCRHPRMFDPDLHDLIISLVICPLNSHITDSVGAVVNGVSGTITDEIITGVG